MSDYSTTFKHLAFSDHPVIHSEVQAQIEANLLCWDLLLSKATHEEQEIIETLGITPYTVLVIANVYIAFLDIVENEILLVSFMPTRKLGTLLEIYSRNKITGVFPWDDVKTVGVGYF